GLEFAPGALRGLDHGDGGSVATEAVRGRESGDPSPDHDDVRCFSHVSSFSDVVGHSGPAAFRGAARSPVHAPFSWAPCIPGRVPGHTWERPLVGPRYGAQARCTLVTTFPERRRPG